MPKLSESRYYPSQKGQREQLQMLVLMFVGTFLFALYLKDPIARLVLLLISFIYPAVILLNKLSTVPRWNYAEITSEGLLVTRLKFIHKTYKWSSVEHMDTLNLSGTDAIGIIYKNSDYPDTWGNYFRQKMAGFDEVVREGYRADGSALSQGALKSFKKFLSRNKI